MTRDAVLIPSRHENGRNGNDGTNWLYPLFTKGSPAMTKKRKSADDRIAELEAAVEASRRELDEQWIKEDERERERQGRGE